MKMTPDDSYTSEQLGLIGYSGGVFVDACPGAGKTQTIVERFVSRPHADNRRGLALISFTNAAVDEVRRRCSAHQDLLKSPNFVGTIDSFINRFITAPVYASRFQQAPTFKDSWEDSSHSAFQAGLSNTRFELHWFSFSADGTARFDAANVPFRDRKQYKRLSITIIAEAESKAAEIFKEHLKSGVIDCSYSRIFMTACLEDPETNETLASLISSRFSEVIVDEIQDCCPSDVALLDFLVEAGVAVVMVGDPDQAIYNFRGSAVQATRQLTGKVEQGGRLSGNFRSTPSICLLIDSLRSGDSVDVAVGQNRHLSIPVILLPVDRMVDQSEALRDVADRYGIDASRILCISYAAENARTISGDVDRRIAGRSGLTRIAAATSTLRDIKNASSRDFKRAQTSLIARIRELHPDRELRFSSDSDFIDAVGLTHREFRAGLSRLVYAAEAFTMTAEEYRSVVIDALGRNGWEWVSSDLVAVPKVWSTVLEPPEGALRWSTVHGYKGLEEECVAVAVPNPPDWAAGSSSDGVHCWSTGRASESRRVLYVAASRAQKLAIIVAEQDVATTIESVLIRDRVPHERI